MAKSPQTILKGNPPTSIYQPDIDDLQEWMEDTDALTSQVPTVVADATAQADRAEAAADAAGAFLSVEKRFAEATLAAAISAGLAATANGEDFVATGADVDYVGLYLNDGGTAAEYVEARLPKSGSTPVVEDFETLADDGLIILLDESGNSLALDDPTILTARDEVIAARGTASTLDTRLANGLTPYGDINMPYINEQTLRNVRRKLRLLQQGYSTQLIMNFFGDSWCEGPYIMPYLAKALHDQYGLAGVGWVGFQHFSATSATLYTDGGTQPATPQGNAREDLVTTPVLDGAWSNNNGGEGATYNPSIGGITSSDVGAYVRFGFPANHDAADLHYFGDGTGVVRYSWDGGSTWETSISLTSTTPSHVALSNVPSAAGTLRIEVVSGNVSLAGVYLKSSDDGVRLNALGASGSNSSQWAGVGVSDWAARVATLGADFTGGILATNDQSGAVDASVVGANAASLLGAIAANDPESDLFWMAPPENTRDDPPEVTMAQYTAATRAAAVDGGWAFLDLQSVFGADPSDYDYSSSRQLLDSSDIHPSRPAGGMAVADAILRLISPNL